MPVKKNIKQLSDKIRTYKKRFLNKRYESLDEASTRLMINSFLKDVLGYAEFTEIKTEFRISGGYADYVIQLGRKKHFVVEVKSISLDLNEKHLRQGVGYAVNEGIDWVLLTNGKTFSLYRVLFTKPTSSKMVFEYDLSKERSLGAVCEDISVLTKNCVQREELKKYWERFEIAEPQGLSRLLYHQNIVSSIKRTMRKESGLNFSDEEVLGALHDLITKPIKSTKPRKPIGQKKRRSSQKPGSEITVNSGLTKEDINNEINAGLQLTGKKPA